MELHRRLTESLGKLTDLYEIIFVDDASPQKNWDIISGIARWDPKVKAIKLSRNFGQHYAITAGLTMPRATGLW